jgi:hypothetical protein
MKEVWEKVIVVTGQIKRFLGERQVLHVALLYISGSYFYISVEICH